MTSPDAPIPAGTPCWLGSVPVRVYADIWPGTPWDGWYRCVDGNGQRHGVARRDHLKVIGGAR